MQEHPGPHLPLPALQRGQLDEKNRGLPAQHTHRVRQEKAEADRLGIEVKAHDAIGDVLTLKLFLSELRKSVQEKFVGENPVEKMAALTQEPILVKNFRFGKYKGKELVDVAHEDAGYLRWMLKSMDTLDADMKYSIEKVLKD